MDNIPENNLFELTLSPQGATWLLRLHKIIRWLFMLVIALSVLLLVNVAIKYRIYMTYKGDTWVFIFQTKIYPIVEILVLIIAFVQNYYFLSFTRISKKSIEAQQGDLFNESFKWLYKVAVIASILTIIQFIIVSIATYGDFVILSTMK
jgi:hypothetical protein